MAENHDTWIALWRGINVGKAKRIAMAELRVLLEEMGYGEVRTVLNSGNAVLRSAALSDSAAVQIRAAVAERFGVDAAVQLVAAASWHSAIEGNPLADLADAEPSRFLLHFLTTEVGDGLRALARREWGTESLALGDQVAYVHCPDGVLQSQAGKALAKTLGDGATARNWKTVLRIAELL